MKPRDHGVRALASIAFLIPWLMPRPAVRTDQAAWSQLLAAFESRGVAIINNHPRCQEPDLYGLYVRGRRQVVVCERGDRSSTLRHEGWHLVQSLCLRGEPWLSQQQLDERLNREDRRELQSLVSPDHWWREAEARAMAHLRPAVFVLELDRACAAWLPQQQR